MKLTTTPTSAPALTRGLAVLRLLEDGAVRSLEEVARKLRLPKASALRLLRVLEREELVGRGADKRYGARWALRPLDAEQAWLERVHGTLPKLARLTGCTAEWYEPSAGGMVLRQHADPLEAEVRVQVRPGFLRAWGSELEAVAKLGYAFAEIAPPPVKGLTHYPTNGEQARLPLPQSRRLIQQAKASAQAADAHFNSNGIRRVATAVIADDGAFRGVLAVAEPFHFNSPPQPTALLKKLAELTQAHLS